MAVVARATEDVRLRLENERLAGELALSRAVALRSPAMDELAVLVARAARRDVTVLVTGESGTGKERIAEAIVGGARRAGQPFVRFNCAALTPDLAEAELFGHAKGAFTGAQRARPGLFREAHLGTLLLDEIASSASMCPRCASAPGTSARSPSSSARASRGSSRWARSARRPSSSPPSRRGRGPATCASWRTPSNGWSPSPTARRWISG
jgi:hypothetical protein